MPELDAITNYFRPLWHTTFARATLAAVFW
jgi:hypothetical protein